MATIIMRKAKSGKPEYYTSIGHKFSPEYPEALQYSNESNAFKDMSYILSHHYGMQYRWQVIANYGLETELVRFTHSDY